MGAQLCTYCSRRKTRKAHYVYTQVDAQCRLTALGVGSSWSLDKCIQLLCNTEGDFFFFLSLVKFAFKNAEAREIQLNTCGSEWQQDMDSLYLHRIILSNLKKAKSHLGKKKKKVFPGTKSQILFFEACSLPGGEWSGIPCTQRRHEAQVCFA